MPTQTELNKYNKVKHSNYSMQQIKTRLWKLFNYQKTRNPDYYVKPRRVELLPEIKKLWKSGILKMQKNCFQNLWKNGWKYWMNMWKRWQ